MGFFKDFKRDFAQAVNELMPDPNELGAEYDDEDMVNTFDEGDLMEVAPEDLLEDLDDIKIADSDFSLGTEEDLSMDKPSSEDSQEETNENIYDHVPNAEIIVDQQELNMNTFDEADDKEVEPEMLQGEKVVKKNTTETSEVIPQESLENIKDEMVALETLDEEDMLENTEEALAVEPDRDEQETPKHKDMDILQAVENTLTKSAGSHGAPAKEDDVPQEELLKTETSVTELEIPVPTTEMEKKASKEETFASDITYITKSTTVKGDVESDGDIDVIGTVIGNVTCEGKLVVAGSITGNVTAGEMYANAAKIEGETKITDSVKIGVGSIIVGNVYAGSAVIAGAVKGDIDVQGPVIVDSTAVIMGNIKSRSVQINNGAVIEGMCSQCYSEIDVKSFFE